MNVIHVAADRVAALEAKIEYLTSRQQIADVYVRFTRGFDRQDEELVKSVFWPDAQVNYGKSQSFPRDQFIARHLPAHKRFASYAHHITSQAVDIAGDVAHVESYVLAFFRAQDDKSTTIAGGRYIDRVDRRNGEWRVAVREFFPHYWIEANSIFETSFAAADWPRTGCWLGTRDKSDPSYRRPLNPRANPDVGPACTD
jgi:hypothetical protein